MASCSSSVSKEARVKKNYAGVNKAAGTCEKKPAAARLFIVLGKSDEERNCQP